MAAAVSGSACSRSGRASLVLGDDAEQAGEVAVEHGDVVGGEGQRVVDLVGHPGGEGAERRELLGVDELPLGLLDLAVGLAEPLVGVGELLGPPPQLLLGVDAVGDVLEEAADVVDGAIGLVAGLGEDPHVVPLAVAVADPEDEVVSFAQLDGLAKLVLGQPPVVLVDGVEQRPRAVDRPRPEEVAECLRRLEQAERLRPEAADHRVARARPAADVGDFDQHRPADRPVGRPRGPADRRGLGRGRRFVQDELAVAIGATDRPARGTPGGR